jgi:hypothetical protein
MFGLNVTLYCPHCKKQFDTLLGVTHYYNYKEYKNCAVAQHGECGTVFLVIDDNNSIEVTKDVKKELVHTQTICW